MLILKKHPFISAFLAGALSALSFAPLYLLPLFMIGLMIIWYASDLFLSYKKTALIGYLFGFGHFMIGFYWIGNALLIDAPTFGWLYPITLLGCGAFFGAFFIFPLIAWRFFKNSSLWTRISAFSAVFVIMEYIRACFLTGFPWNMAGSIFTFSDILIQSASVIGTYGLSFMICCFTGSLYAIFQKKYQSGIFVLSSILILLTGFGIHRLKRIPENKSELQVRLVQPSIPQSMKWDEESLEDNLQTYISMSVQNRPNEVRFVVWGETATAFDLEYSPYFQDQIRKAVPQNGYLMTGMLRYDDSSFKMYNSMGVFDDQANMVAFYDKNHLVPFGEYIPFRAYLPSWLHPVTNMIADISVTQKYKKIKIPGLPPFSALICYEIIFPDEILDRIDKPSFIVLVSNDGWYGNSSGPYQHLSSAKMRAVEEGITIIRSANNGISALIDPMGRIIEQIDLNEKAFRDIKLPNTLSVPTFYATTNFSKYFLTFLIALLALLGLKTRVYKH